MTPSVSTHDTFLVAFLSALSDELTEAFVECLNTHRIRRKCASISVSMPDPTDDVLSLPVRIRVVDVGGDAHNYFERYRILRDTPYGFARAATMIVSSDIR